MVWIMVLIVYCALPVSTLTDVLGTSQQSEANFACLTFSSSLLIVLPRDVSERVKGACSEFNPQVPHGGKRTAVF